jgi:AraC-like DNA-binding protein/mannose-6-phosphate isomerase-like protein (cupin superfamily)
MSDMKRLQKTPEHRSWPVTRVLFIQQSLIKKGNATNWHRHSFWQTEFVISGAQLVCFGGASHRLKKGDIILIPMDCVHRYEYPYRDTGSCSVKYSVQGIEGTPEPVVAAPSRESDGIRDLIIGLLAQREPIREQSVRTIEHLLAALLDIQYGPQGQARPETELVRSVREYLDMQGGDPVTVADVAGEIGYSRSRLSELFHEQAGMTLKQYIDEHRADVAESLLRYSDYNVTRIADTMGFPDLFTFSRFFKRTKGESPRGLRKRGLAAHERK